MSNTNAKNFYLFSVITVSLFVGTILFAINSKPVIAADSPATTAAAPAPSTLTMFSEGKHFITKFPESTRAKEPVVVEFFSYMCPHCYRLESTMKRWEKQKPADIKLEKIPVSFTGNRMYEIAARAHYIAEELGVLDTFSDAMFKKIHIDRRPPRNDRDLANLFKTLGVSDDAFKKASVNNFNVESKLRRANFLMKQYQVNGVPYILVNYKYEVGEESFRTEDNLFNLWNNLPYKGFK